MRTPHPEGNGPYQDHLKNRILPEEEERLIGTGYTFLGWNPTHDSVAELGRCMDAAHNYHSAFPNAWHSVKHTPDGSDTTQWCSKCRTYWKVNIS